MKLALSPRVVVPTVFGVGVIVFLLGYADVGRVARAASTFHPMYLLLILLLTLGYEALRAAQWHYFLRVLDPGETRQASLMSYMGGEITKVLPGGQYFQTYLLRQARGVPIACSVAATTIIIWLEAVVCLAVIAILGVERWAWVRPVALVLLAGVALVVTALRRRSLSPRLVRLARRHQRLRPFWAWYDEFAGCANELLHGRTLAVAATLSAGYIAIAAAGLWAISAALGLSGVGPLQALVVYCFALGVGLIIPIPIDLGLTEFSGLTALIAFGVTRADALTVMLIQRVLSTVLTAIIAMVSLTALRRQVVAALRPQAVGDE